MRKPEDPSVNDDSSDVVSSLSTDWLPTLEDVGNLPENMQPTQGESGMISSFLNITTAGIGSVLVVFFVAIGSIPTGLYIALRELVGGLRTFLIEFIAVFFQPFEIGAECLATAGQQCEPQLSGIESTNAFIAAAGVAGFAASIVVVGAMAYVTSQVVRRFV